MYDAYDFSLTKATESKEFKQNSLKQILKSMQKHTKTVAKSNEKVAETIAKSNEKTSMFLISAAETVHTRALDIVQAAESTEPGEVQAKEISIENAEAERIRS